MKDGLQFRVGLFTLFGLFVCFAFSIAVNKKPLWWNKCSFVNIEVQDATGLKLSSAVRSMGVEIGYLTSVSLKPSSVSVSLCLASSVSVNATTKAYVRSDGILGDKFIELKPVFLSPKAQQLLKPFSFLWGLIISSAQAEEAPSIKAESGADLNHIMKRVDDLVNEVTEVAKNIKESISPEMFKETIGKLNKAIDNVSKTVAPEGGLNQTAQRSLAKLEDAIEQLRSIFTRINRGEGSIGMLINDPSYALEIKRAIDNINRLLDRVSRIRFILDLNSQYLTQYSASRSAFSIGIWTRPDRYYLFGLGSDPRGSISEVQTSTSVGGQAVTTQTTSFNNVLFSFMMGKVYQRRLDLSVGVLLGYATGSLLLHLGPEEHPQKFQLRSDFYFIQKADARLSFSFFLTESVYLRAGIESFRPHPITRKPVFTFGLGISFDDEDLKLLLALK